MILVLTTLWSASLPGQTGIGGSATVTLLDGGVDCQGRARLVEVHVDISGLSGTGGLAGLNSYVLSFGLSRPEGFASAWPGSEPNLAWGLCHTDPIHVAQTNGVVLVGWAPDPNAPNGDYWVASLLFSGQAGELIVSFDPNASSLGSRVVNSDGPGAIDLSGASPLSIVIPVNFDLDLLTGVSYWLTENADYDLVPDSPQVNILDLTKLVQCGA